MIAFNAVPCKNLASFATTIATITSDNEKALLDAVKTLNKIDGVIYINTPIIKESKKDTIKLSGSVAEVFLVNNNQVVLIQLLILNLKEIMVQLLEVSPLVVQINI